MQYLSIPQFAVWYDSDIKTKTIIGGEQMQYIRIRHLREDKDLTQKEMASILNCSQQVYSNYELGQRDIPTEVLIALAKFHKVSVDYILGLCDTPSYPHHSKKPSQ